MAHDVFISHSAKDKTIADAVCATFESRGIRCWIAQRDIPYGADWGETIIDAISGSRVMIVIISRNANESAQVKREVERAVNRGVIIIPFRVENIPLSKALEYHISTTHWMDALTPPLEQHIHRLSERVRALLPKPKPINPGTAGTQVWGTTPPITTSTTPPPVEPDRSYYGPGAGRPSPAPPPERSFPPSNYYGPQASPYQSYPPGHLPAVNPPVYVQPNRGKGKAQIALIVGIVGAFTGFIGIGLLIGPFAIHLGNQEIKAIKAGQSPPSGQGLATAAIICGWTGVGLGIFFVIGVILGAMGVIR
jgi:hypothetical protein